MLKVQIGRGDTVPFEFKESADIFFGKVLTEEENFFGEIEVVGEIINSNGTYTARGKTACQRNFFCDRCLTKSSGKIICEFDEELDDAEISENVADITELVRDTFLASMPIQNLCRDDCKGLCPVCGKNLNDGDCNCDRLKIDPRLAVLKNLKLD